VIDAGHLLVEGVNVAKKHQKGNPNAGVAGGIIEKEMPIDSSNVLLWNAKSNKGDRVGFKFEGEGEKRRKVRYFKSNQEVVDG
jgi:large subunit ribosomal protein L24